jgi:hypothetical protein
VKRLPPENGTGMFEIQQGLQELAGSGEPIDGLKLGGTTMINFS